MLFLMYEYSSLGGFIMELLSVTFVIASVIVLGYFIGYTITNS
ncbi:hypothetical protein [Cytobacillus mangrovibacter]